MLSLNLHANAQIGWVAAGVVVTVIAGSIATAAAQSPLQRQPNAREKQKLFEQIAADGLNCPVLGTIDNAGEDARGKMIRIHCKSLSGSATWDIRGIAAPHAAELRFESW
ncbi:MAG: hypothetical protein JSS22_15290 [Proteobacteria bacterium]|nr:hypothetical protein [Pseudomonadota bacterium]